MRKNRLGGQQRPHSVQCHFCGVCKDEGSLKAQARTMQNMSSTTESPCVWSLVSQGKDGAR